MITREMPKGVEIHGKGLRLTFFINGERCRESIGISPSSQNIAAAGARLQKIERDINRGTFNYEREFPHSLRVKRMQEANKAAVLTFGQAADSYLKTVADKTPATVDQYTNALGVFRVLLGEDTPVMEITHTQIAELVGSYPWASSKLKNNYLIPLRGTFALLYKGRAAYDSPMHGISNAKIVSKKPDPLDPEERDLILADMRQRYDIRVWAYFAWAFFTGMRPEEIIALRWSDVDFRKASCMVQRVRTFKGSEREGSKTHAARPVLLTPQAIEALTVMRPFTQMKGGDIFEHPTTGAPWHDDRSQRDTFWKPTLARLGIRSRRPYTTRHTCASVALMAGVNAGFMAQQLGHSTRMFLDIYATWINGKQDQDQMALLAKATAPAPAIPEPDQAAHK